MSKNSGSRERAEQQEGLPQVNNDVPENKMQGTQEIGSADNAQNSKPADSSFSAKEENSIKGDSLKQQKISDVITGSSGTAGMGTNAAGRGVSGTMGGILGADNSTPRADKSRSDSRLGKKLDRVATKLNYTPSEQVLLNVDESKPLAKSADQPMGFNGTYRNVTARSQKIAGAVPADLMFQRSVDFIMKDKLYFAEGQFVFSNDSQRTSPNPTKTYDAKLGGYKSVTYHSGNFLHRRLHFGLRPNGKVKYFYADVEELGAENYSQEQLNQLPSHRLIKEHIAELDRMTADTKAGDEKAEIWSPLPRAIQQPTQTFYLLSSIEGDTGAYVCLAYQKATTAMAYQLNRGPKDGLDVIRPAIDFVAGWRNSSEDSASEATALAGNNVENLFNTTHYRAGDPSIFIAAYDSPRKYNNKADFLLQPRGFRMHLQTADNNMNSFYTYKLLSNVYAETECFGTIDHEYDPLMPIVMTDKANLILSHNLNELCAFWEQVYANVDVVLSATKIKDGDGERMTVKVLDLDALAHLGYAGQKISIYKKDGAANATAITMRSGNKVLYFSTDGTNVSEKTYQVKVAFGEATIDGWTKLCSYTIGTDTGSVTFEIPTVQTTSDTVVTQADVTTNYVDLQYYNGGQFAYDYDDLRNNYITYVKHPLIEGIIQYLENEIGAKFRSLLEQDDFCVDMVFSSRHMTTAALLICAATPWIQRVRVNSMKDVIYYQDNVKSYPFQKLINLKDVPLKNYKNMDYSDYDHPLGAKVLDDVQTLRWVLPEFWWLVNSYESESVNHYDYVTPWYFNENDFEDTGAVRVDSANMSMPSIRSGIRLANLDRVYGMSEKDILLSLDRISKYFFELDKTSIFAVYKYGVTTDGQPVVDVAGGFTLNDITGAPRELGLEFDAPAGLLTHRIGVASLDAGSERYRGPSFRVVVYQNPNAPQHPEINDTDGINITRAANYVQKWTMIESTDAYENCDIGGLVFGMGDDAIEYQPWTDMDGVSASDFSVKISSYQRSLNTRLQFLPFVISPFDGVQLTGQNHDIYDVAYMFGLCGFRASDYREMVYNRESEVINQGLLFVDDPWVLDSPIVKSGASSTGNSETKGYVIH